MMHAVLDGPHRQQEADQGDEPGMTAASGDDPVDQRWFHVDLTPLERVAISGNRFSQKARSKLLKIERRRARP